MGSTIRPESSFTMMFSIACEEADRASRMGRALEDLLDAVAASGEVDAEYWTACVRDDAPLCGDERDGFSEPCSLFAGHGGEHVHGIRSPRVTQRERTLARNAA